MSDIDPTPAPPTVTLTLMPNGQVNITANCPVAVALNVVQATYVELITAKVKHDLQQEQQRVALVNHLPRGLRPQ